MIVEERIFDLLMFAFIFGLGFYLILTKRTGPELRIPPALAAAPEAVNRCAELGKSIVVGTGWGGVSTPIGLAGVSLIGHVCDLAYPLRVPVTYVCCAPDTMPVVSDLMSSAMAKAGLSEGEVPVDIRYAAGDPPAVVMMVIENEAAGAYFDIGTHWPWTAMVMETCNRVGAISITGTELLDNLPLLVALGDYAFLGEECFSTAAIASKDPTHLASIFSEDIVKLVLMVFLLVGVLLSLANNSGLINLLMM